MMSQEESKRGEKRGERRGENLPENRLKILSAMRDDPFVSQKLKSVQMAVIKINLEFDTNKHMFLCQVTDEKESEKH